MTCYAKTAQQQHFDFLKSPLRDCNPVLKRFRSSRCDEHHSLESTGIDWVLSCGFRWYRIVLFKGYSQAMFVMVMFMASHAYILNMAMPRWRGLLVFAA
jgi:hypothetical protein